jgi:hypothetical protein
MDRRMRVTNNDKFNNAHPSTAYIRHFCKLELD